MWICEEEQVVFTLCVSGFVRRCVRKIDVNIVITLCVSAYVSYIYIYIYIYIRVHVTCVCIAYALVCGYVACEYDVRVYMCVNANTVCISMFTCICA